MSLHEQVEAELQQLEKAEALEYLQSLGVDEGGLRSLIKATYHQLGLATYFTTGVLWQTIPAVYDLQTARPGTDCMIAVDRD